MGFGIFVETYLLYIMSYTYYGATQIEKLDKKFLENKNYFVRAGFLMGLGCEIPSLEEKEVIFDKISEEATHYYGTSSADSFNKEQHTTGNYSKLGSWGFTGGAYVFLKENV